MVTSQTDFVPKRDFLRGDPEGRTSALPTRVPIVGLGCSSFSTFFWTQDELAGPAHENATDGKAQSAATDITAATLTRNHPRVREWIDAIRCAILECGITLLDTAPWYGHGTSEMVVGWALREILAGGETSGVTRADLCVNTKVGRYEADPAHQFDFSREATLSSAERSLSRLKCDYIDVFQLHDPEFSPKLDLLLNETIPAMVECRTRGWCRALGLTGYPLEVQYQILQDSLERYGSEASSGIWDQALTYGHFNLHDSSLVHRRVSSSCESFADCCFQHNMGVLAAAPLSMGLLTHSASPDWHPANGTALAEACDRAAAICSEHGVDIATLALLYALSHPSLPCTLLGMKNVHEVRTAAALARRFGNVDWSLPGLTQDLVLSFVLTAKERRAYDILSDPKEGPFAEVWERTTEDDYDGTGAYRPKYQWDGVREAHTFWRALGAPFEEWQHTSFR